MNRARTAAIAVCLCATFYSPQHPLSFASACQSEGEEVGKNLESESTATGILPALTDALHTSLAESLRTAISAASEFVEASDKIPAVQDTQMALFHLSEVVRLLLRAYTDTRNYVHVMTQREGVEERVQKLMNVLASGTRGYTDFDGFKINEMGKIPHTRFAASGPASSASPLLPPKEPLQAALPLRPIEQDIQDSTKHPVGTELADGAAAAAAAAKEAAEKTEHADAADAVAVTTKEAVQEAAAAAQDEKATAAQIQLVASAAKDLKESAALTASEVTAAVEADASAKFAAAAADCVALAESETKTAAATTRERASARASAMGGRDAASFAVVAGQAALRAGAALGAAALKAGVEMAQAAAKKGSQADTKAAVAASAPPAEPSSAAAPSASPAISGAAVGAAAIQAGLEMAQEAAQKASQADSKKATAFTLPAEPSAAAAASVSPAEPSASLPDPSAAAAPRRSLQDADEKFEGQSSSRLPGVDLAIARVPQIFPIAAAAATNAVDAVVGSTQIVAEAVANTAGEIRETRINRKRATVFRRFN
ncbi:hypothetical protein Esti_003478 [Eimeria stiedai]